MPTFYGYTFALLGSQTTDENGNAINYRFAPNGTWRYSGTDTYFVVEEADSSNTTFDGDPSNEDIGANIQIGGSEAQTVEIDGVDRQLIWDYTFEVSLGSQTWRIGVIDVDLDNSDLIEAGSENGYYLVFPDGLPPANTNLTIGSIIENDADTSHSGLGGTVVCFAAGTLIDTADGPRAVERLEPGDMIVTRDSGLQPLRWVGQTRVPAQAHFAPIVIDEGVLGNTHDLVLSPQHSVLLEDWRAEFFYGSDDVLVRAKDLLDHDGVYQRPGGIVTYCHILFDSHQLVCSEGIWSESLYPGDVTRQTVNADARAEIEILFPDVKGYGPKSARCLRRFEAACLVA